MKTNELQKHIWATYFTLRIGIALIAFVFPVLLWGYGTMKGIEFQNSMSAYYHATASNGYSMRDWFVGILFAIGVFLYLYKGYSKEENYALNIAGVFAIGVAIFPMDWNGVACCREIPMHGISAGFFILSIAYVCIRLASDTLYLMRDEVLERRYRILYWLIGFGMILSPAIGLVLALIFDEYKSFAFFAEAAVIWIFAAYWLLKSLELSSTNAERLALDSKIGT